MTERTLTGLRVERGLKLEELVELHLDDKAVELLKSDRINNRRLCEILSHEKFKELLTDTEIYVDGMTAILHDIRKAHENDIESAPSITPADQTFWYQLPAQGEMKSTVSGFFRPLASALLCKLTG